MSRIALGAILLCASAAALSTENVLWTAFVALKGAEQAVAQEAPVAQANDVATATATATAAAAGPPSLSTVVATTLPCVRGLCQPPPPPPPPTPLAKEAKTKRVVTKRKAPRSSSGG